MKEVTIGLTEVPCSMPGMIWKFFSLYPVLTSDPCFFNKSALLVILSSLFLNSWILSKQLNQASYKISLSLMENQRSIENCANSEEIGIDPRHVGPWL